MRLLAAIPNYNAAHNLPHLLRTLHDEPYDAIYLLDDASTDNSLSVLEEMNTDTVVVAGKENLGPGGNRNRILPYLEPGDIVHFIDADMELLSTNYRHKILEVFAHEPKTALVGGLIFSKKDTPMTFNYGYFSNIPRDIAGFFFEALSYALPLPSVRKALARIAQPFTFNVAIRYDTPQRHMVDWTSEANFFISGDVFKQLNGFSKELRYHEGQDLSWRARQAELDTVFWPEVHARHLAFKVRHSKIDHITNMRKLFKSR